MASALPELLKNQRHRQILREYSGVEVYFLPELSAYLKIGVVEKNSNLRWEHQVLKWLSDKIPVPRLLGFEAAGGVEYILISEIVGEPCSDHLAALLDPMEIEHLAERVAGHIRRMHDLPIGKCMLDQRLDAKFKKAAENIACGFVDETDFDAENLGKKASTIFDELIFSRPMHEDLVFTHGDLCLPNIIIRDHDLSGFIDFDRGGVADRYQDISLFLRSFRYNSSDPIEIENAFCRGYGIDALDQPKLDFYRKLDELF